MTLLAMLALASVDSRAVADSGPAVASAVPIPPPPQKPEQSFEQPNLASAFSADEGYVFFDGQYIAPPYVLSYDDTTVRLNDIDLIQSGIQLDSLKDKAFGFGRRGFRRFGGQSYGGPQQQGPEQQGPEQIDERMFPRGNRGIAIDLSSFLKMQHTVVLFHGHAPYFLSPTTDGLDLTKLLVTEGPRPIADTEFLAASLTAKGIAPADWQGWVDAFQPTDSLVQRVSASRQSIDDNVQQSEVISLFAWWQTQLAYPLTVLGMVLVVFAFGHLLSERPRLAVSLPDGGYSVEQERAVRRSLALVLAFSAMDLIWTILASQGGLMRELNPLGSGLIENPALLVVFKMALTAMAVGLLYRLRRQPIAEQAAWWSCLLLTLLTARWLTFNSMFIA